MIWHGITLKALDCNFTKRNTPPWVFFKFFNLYKWYQIGQRITHLNLLLCQSHPKLPKCLGWKHLVSSLLGPKIKIWANQEIYLSKIYQGIREHLKVFKPSYLEIWCPWINTKNCAKTSLYSLLWSINIKLMTNLKKKHLLKILNISENIIFELELRFIFSMLGMVAKFCFYY